MNIVSPIISPALTGEMIGSVPDMRERVVQGRAGLLPGTAVDERRVGNLLETGVILMAGRQI
jgi:hypothetical protein